MHVTRRATILSQQNLDGPEDRLRTVRRIKRIRSVVLEDSAFHLKVTGYPDDTATQRKVGRFKLGKVHF